MGTIQIDGSTPKLTIGNATAEDATILFDGNAQDFYIALDDSADDLLIGLGSTVGTTPIIAIDENKLSTFSGAITVGVDDTGHDVKLFGATAGSFLLWDESADALLLTDSTPIQIGDAQDLTLYNDGSNSYITNKTGALKVATETSGIAITLGHTTSEVTVADNFTVTGTITLADGSLALADLDIDGGTDIGAAIVDADLFIVDDGAGGTNRKTAASRLKTYIGGGISEFDMWRYTADTTGDQDPITSNWERVDTSFDKIGTGMSESSGIFSFPSTGIWLIEIKSNWYLDGEARDLNFKIGITTDNSSYTYVSIGGGSLFHAASSNTTTTTVAHFAFDVTNVSNDKCQFGVTTENDDAHLYGATATNHTYMIFTRIGDT